MVSISSRRSGWICRSDTGRDLGPLPLHPPMPSRHLCSASRPAWEMHLIHGTDLQAQLVHHRDEELGANVCMRRPRPRGPRVGAALPPTGLIPLGGRAQVSPAQAPSGLRNPLFVLSLPTLQLRCPAVTQTSSTPEALSLQLSPRGQRAAVVHGPALTGPPRHSLCGSQAGEEPGGLPGCSQGGKVCSPLLFPATGVPHPESQCCTALETPGLCTCGQWLALAPLTPPRTLGPWGRTETTSAMQRLRLPLSSLIVMGRSSLILSMANGQSS